MLLSSTPSQGRRRWVGNVLQVLPNQWTRWGRLCPPQITSGSPRFKKIPTSLPSYCIETGIIMKKRWGILAPFFNVIPPPSAPYLTAMQLKAFYLVYLDVSVHTIVPKRGNFLPRDIILLLSVGCEIACCWILFMYQFVKLPTYT